MVNTTLLHADEDMGRGEHFQRPYWQEHESKTYTFQEHIGENMRARPLQPKNVLARTREQGAQSSKLYWRGYENEATTAQERIDEEKREK